MKHLYFLCSLLVVAIVSSCADNASGDEYYNDYGIIAGSVSDKTTGEPVATVNVTLDPSGASTVTGSDGTFSFHNLYDYSYTLSISKAGYKPNSTEVYTTMGETTPVHLLIERIPAIVTADRDLLDFGSNASVNTLSFNIVNSSYEDLEWEIEERCDWITEVKPQKGTLRYGKTEAIVVVIDRLLLSKGANEAVLVVRSSNGSTEVRVTAEGDDHALPSLNVYDATDITTTSATLNGEITDAGKPTYTERGFVYATTSIPTLENATKVTAPYSTAKTYSCTIEKLTFGETYYVRAYASNIYGVAYSKNEIYFTPQETLPEVETLEITDADISAGTATFRGTIVTAGDPPYTERGFVYSTTHEPTINDNVIKANGSGVTGSYSVYVENLPKTSYFVRAYVTNHAGTAYGEEVEVSEGWIALSALGIAVQTKDIGCNYWSSVNSMCENSTLGGYTDWRLPNKDELMSLYVNKDQIGNFKNGVYWSSSYTYSYYYYYYYIDFRDGSLSYTRYTDETKYGRCVRTISNK